MSSLGADWRTWGHGMTSSGECSTASSRRSGGCWETNGTSSTPDALSSGEPAFTRLIREADNIGSQSR